MFKYLMLFVLLVTDLCAGSLKVVLAGDTDSNLTDQIEKDIQLLTTQSQKLSRHLNRPLELKVLKGSRASKQQFIAIVQNLDVQPDDILIVFYSGHGFRDKFKKSPYPYMFFTQTKESLDTDDMLNVVYQKKAQFAILMVDACNLPFAHLDEPDEGKEIYDNFNTYGDITCNLRPLFESGRGVLVIASCSPGEVAWASRAGGYFTQAFLDSIYTNNCSSCSNWNIWIRNLQAKTESIQHPVCSFYK